MTSQQSVKTRKDPAAKSQSDLKQSDLKVVLRPAVDIFENGDSIRLFADLPGVTDDTLTVEIDDKTLTIQGDIALDMPGDIESLYADVRSTRYQRAFTLSSELDTSKINASLSNGLLTLTIPKREEVRPRRIEIASA